MFAAAEVSAGIMRLTCPSCAAIYEVEDVAIPASGRRVRCGACDESWRVSGDGSPRRITPPPISIPASLNRAADRLETTASPEPETPAASASGSPAQPKPAEPESIKPADAEKPESEAPAPEKAADAPAPKPAPRPVIRQAEKASGPGEKPKAGGETKRGEAEDLSVGPAESAMRSVMGFLLGFALVVLIFAPYLFRTQIVAIFPGAEPTIDAYNGVLRTVPDGLRDGYDFVADEVGYLLGGLSMDESEEAQAPQDGGRTGQ